VVKAGRPLATSASTVTTYASMPSTAPEKARESKKDIVLFLEFIGEISHRVPRVTTFVHHVNLLDVIAVKSIHS
jgi:hypothetical protein